jgi:hypothetical protein
MIQQLAQAISQVSQWTRTTKFIFEYLYRPRPGWTLKSFHFLIFFDISIHYRFTLPSKKNLGCFGIFRPLARVHLSIRFHRFWRTYGESDFVASYLNIDMDVEKFALLCVPSVFILVSLLVPSSLKARTYPLAFKRSQIFHETTPYLIITFSRG